MVVTIIAAFFIIHIYRVLDPETTLFPKCPFYWATGLKCPGCGSQRALHQLLNLRLGAALQYNAGLILFIPILFFILIATLLRNKCPKMNAIIHSPIFAWSLMGLLLLWWILRNIFGW